MPKSILSMTAFARESVQSEWGELIWEIRSVNHRYLDMHLRLPEALRVLDLDIRQQVKQTLQRGKVDITATLRMHSSDAGLQINEEMVGQLLQAQSQLVERFGIAGDLSSAMILRWPEVLQAQALDEDTLKKVVSQSLSQALEKLVAHRKREGEQIRHMLEEKVVLVEEEVAKVKAILPEVQGLYREKLQQRFAEAQVELDPERLEQEMVHVAQKIDVVEELDRLTAHVKELHHILKQGGVVGRKLDFLMQEFNREANTLSSKSIDSRTTKAAMEMKVLIEQMREQIQNLE